MSGLPTTRRMGSQADEIASIRRRVLDVEARAGRGGGGGVIVNGDTLTIGSGAPTIDGHDGDDYVDLDSGDFYTYSGDPSDVPGDTLYLGHGVPAVVALAGDDFIDLDSGDIYTYREA